MHRSKQKKDLYWWMNNISWQTVKDTARNFCKILWIYDFSRDVNPSSRPLGKKKKVMHCGRSRNIIFWILQSLFFLVFPKGLKLAPFKLESSSNYNLNSKVPTRERERWVIYFAPTYIYNQTNLKVVSSAPAAANALF